MPLNVNKCHILQVGKGNKQYEYEMSEVKLKCVRCVKDLGVTIASNLKFYQHCKEVACKASRMLGFIKKKFSFENKDIILPIYITTWVIRPHLEFAVQFWWSHHATDSKITNRPTLGYEDDPVLT